ncbi:MAG TPA: hypothetical protein DEA97_14260 [Bacteroidales bacterium]|nr:MAG: hypothetical protein UR43_C0011G0019 [candidate division TM6 bacterium GW2011_GWF2_33_332]HBS87722.1 hypothetical protein [Bacteroidales bacterium]
MQISNKKNIYQLIDNKIFHMRKRHIKHINDLIFNDSVKTIELNLEKSLKHFKTNEIVLNVKFGYNENLVPENIEYTIVYRELKTNKKLVDIKVLENIHSDIYKVDYWKMPFEKQVGGLIADRLIISIKPHENKSFIIAANELHLLKK